MASGLLYASVAASAGGSNLVVNGSLASSITGWTGVAFSPTLPAAAPIAACSGCGVLTAATTLIIPINATALAAGTVYTLSAYVWVDTAFSEQAVLTGGTVSDSGLAPGTWELLTVSFTATGTDTLALYVPAAPSAPAYVSGVMLTTGVPQTSFMFGQTVEGDPAEVVCDGSDTSITANGLDGYAPVPGDRLLVGRVGNVLEIIQYLSRGTVPWALPDAVATLQSTVSDLAANKADSTSLVNYQPKNTSLDSISGVAGLGTPIVLNQFWVGNAGSGTVVPVPISSFVQGAMASGDSPSLGLAWSLATQADVGGYSAGALNQIKISFISTFYDALTAAGVPFTHYYP